jgi:hypothetical protein
MTSATSRGPFVERSKRFVKNNWATAAVLAALIAGIWNYGGVRGVPQIAAMAIGGGVGVVELMGRYRHAPIRAAFSWSGYAYILINVFASWIALYFLAVFDVFPLAKDANSEGVDRRTVEMVLTAGFGALVFLRSSLFKVRVGDTDVGVGPAAVLDTLLLVADRGVDRREAVSRAQDVSALVSHVRDFEVVANMLTKYSLALMQNVDEKTSNDLGAAVTKILSDPTVPNAIKMDIVALRLGVVVGQDVLEAAVEALGDRLSAAPPLSSGRLSTSQVSSRVADFKGEIDAERPSSRQAAATPPAQDGAD